MDSQHDCNRFVGGNELYPPAFFHFPCATLLQLSALALYIKKINAYHQRLNLFLKTISNYLPLVRLIHDQSFRSPYLQKIRHSLFTPESNSLQALTQLHRIQNSLDQRGNIVIAFILNGLYLKDFHTLLRLDHWRKKYGPDIETWDRRP